jgi:hypothetical protein
MTGGNIEFSNGKRPGVPLEAFDSHQVRGQTGTITAVVNAIAKAGVELGENGSITRRNPRGGVSRLGVCQSVRRIPKCPCNRCKSTILNGEGGIRTHGTVTRRTWTVPGGS